LRDHSRVGEKKNNREAPFRGEGEWLKVLWQPRGEGRRDLGPYLTGGEWGKIEGKLCRREDGIVFLGGTKIEENRFSYNHVIIHQGKKVFVATKEEGGWRKMAPISREKKSRPKIP